MKPKDLVRQTLAERIEPILSEFDFTFSKSSLKFVRNKGDFKQEINTHLNRYNAEDVSAEFYFSFAVYSKKYAKWHLLEYGEKIVNECVASEMYWNLRGWKHPRTDVAHIENLEKDMGELLEDTLSVGLPFLEKFSDWENAANRFVELRQFHEKACDFYLIAGNKEKAHWTLTEALKCWEKYPKRTFFVGEKEAIKLRFSKHFGERINLEDYN
jgi:hypothetical protein